jgi:Tol biopolymer transport system component
VPAPAAQYFELSISPNDTRAALAASSLDNVSDIWTIELSRGTTTRLTVDQRFCENPKWSPDGRWIAFSSLNPPRRDIHRKLSSGAGEVELITPGLGAFSDAAGWSPDGRHLLIRNLEPETGEDVWALPVEGDRKPFPVLHSRYHEEDPSLSPDGRWLAFRSNESGRVELYVQSFPVPDAKQRVSRDGAGTQSRSPLGRAFWRRDGRELVYVGGDGVSVWSVPIVPGGSLSLGTPRLLFRIPPECFEMVATSDLQRFLVLEDRSTKESPSIQMIVNWPAGMRGE